MQGLISSVGSLESGGGGGGSSIYITYVSSVSSQGAFRVISFLSDGSVTNLTSLLSFIRSKGLSLNSAGDIVKCLPCMCGVVRSTSESFLNVDMLFCATTGNTLYASSGESRDILPTNNLTYTNVQLT